MDRRDEKLWGVAKSRAAKTGPVNYGNILKHYRILQSRQLTKAYAEVVGELRQSMMGRLEELRKGRAETELDALLVELEGLGHGRK